MAQKALPPQTDTTEADAAATVTLLQTDRERQDMKERLKVMTSHWNERKRKGNVIA